MLTKQVIRREVLAKRDTMTAEERRRADILVSERILGHQWYYAADSLLLFLSFGSEIDTSILREDAWYKNKKVYVPKVEGREIVFYRIVTMSDTVEGYKGIREPMPSGEKFCYESHNHNRMLMIMPGVAFDRYRNRLGYGKGYYDRYLSDKEEFPTIAMGYACQMVEAIPSEETDIRPGQIICM